MAIYRKRKSSASNTQKIKHRLLETTQMLSVKKPRVHGYTFNGILPKSALNPKRHILPKQFNFLTPTKRKRLCEDDQNKTVYSGCQMYFIYINQNKILHRTLIFIWRKSKCSILRRLLLRKQYNSGSVWRDINYISTCFMNDVQVDLSISTFPCNKTSNSSRSLSSVLFW